MIKQVIENWKTTYTYWQAAQLMKKINKQFDDLEFHRRKYFELKSQCEMVTVALKAGYTSKEDFFNRVKELNQNAEKISKNNSESVVAYCTPPVAAKQLWKEGFPDQVDKEFLKKKTLDIMAQQDALRKVTISHDSTLRI